MTPAYHDEWLTIYGGDVRDVLPSLAADSVDCIVTSPPYWGLRDYGNDGQLGLERTPEEYVANMVAVFRELRRVLKPSGTCWLNLGDSYAGSWGANGRGEGTNAPRPDLEAKHGTNAPNRNPPGIKPKDLVGIPWRVAFALQADGWYLRSDIIWSKPNPMPESVTDRPTKSHEYLFLLTKSARYYFDADAVRERASQEPNVQRMRKFAERVVAAGGDQRDKPGVPGREGNGKGRRVFLDDGVSRNIRSVWTIATRPYPGAHFAVFPPELPERCIKAGSSEKGVCPECGAPWERVVEKSGGDRSATLNPSRAAIGHEAIPRPRSSHQPGWRKMADYETVSVGWKPTCDHDAAPIPAVILDPFGGSGTVGMVANRLSRRAILIDLNPEYLRQQLKRNAQTPLGLTEGDAA